MRRFLFGCQSLYVYTLTPLLPILVPVLDAAVAAPYALCRAWVAGSVLVVGVVVLRELCRSAVVESEEVEEELLEGERSSRSFTHCPTCAMAALAFVMACEGEFVISVWTVANAD